MDKTESELEEDFRYLGDAIVKSFPEIDLRITRQEGSEFILLGAPEHSDDEVSLDLNSAASSEILFEAIFAVKSLARLFDA